MAERNDDRSVDRLDGWKVRYQKKEMPPRELFAQSSHIAILISYDLIDKLRFWEKQTLELPDEQIEKRLDHMVRSLEKLRDAYLTFSEVDP